MLIDMKLDTADLQELRARNEARTEIAKASMGTKWVLHPANSPKKIPQTPVLLSKKR